MTESAVSPAASSPPHHKTTVTSPAVSQENDQGVPPAHPPLTPADMRAVEHLVTEDDTPVDNRFSEKQRRLLTSPLYTSWGGPGRGRPFMVCADVGLFLHPRQAPFVPDVFLSLDVEELQEPWAKAGRSYFIWEYKKAPDVVIEVVSNEKGGEMAAKYAGYAHFGVPCYVIYDPLGLIQKDPVRAWQLTSAGAYRPCPHNLLPGIGLGLQLWRGRFDNLEATWLRWQVASGALVPTGAERAARERENAARERDRADRLEALLRSHGIAPDNGKTNNVE